MDYILLDLKAGKQITKVSQQYAGLDAMKKQLPEVMKKLFPTAKTQLKITGTPAGAKIFLDGKEVGEIPATLEVAPGADIKLKITHPGHRPYEQTLQVEKGKTKELSLTLPKLEKSGTGVVTNPPDRPPPRGENGNNGKVAASPWYSKWWVWAIVGGVAVGAGTTAVILGMNSSKAVWPEIETSL